MTLADAWAALVAEHPDIDIQQVRTLIRNAILTRQDTIDKNKADIAAGTAAAIKGLRKPGRGVDQVNAAGTGLTTKFFDPDIAAAVKSANGDIIKLDEALGKIALRRPDLRGAIREISDAAAATVLKAREDKKAAEEIDILTGKVKTNVGANAGLIEKQVALATATTALEKARARYSLVLTEGAGIENAIRQARGVRHQMAQGDRAAGRLDLVDALGTGLEHAALAKFGDVDLHRVIPANAAFFGQHDHGAGSQQFGAGEHAKDVVLAQRFTILFVGKSGAKSVDHITAFEQGGRDARQKLLVDLGLHRSVQVGK